MSAQRKERTGTSISEWFSHYDFDRDIICIDRRDLVTAVEQVSDLAVRLYFKGGRSSVTMTYDINGAATFILRQSADILDPALEGLNEARPDDEEDEDAA